MNIQTILDKFDKEFQSNSNDDIISLFNDDGIGTKTNIKQFLKDSLTSMLDGIEKELPKETPQEVIDRQTYCVALRSQGENTYRQEVINIINSHRNCKQRL